MTKQEKIREGIEKILDELLFSPSESDDGFTYDLTGCITNLLSYLHSQGCVLKVDREFGAVGIEKPMKLAKMKEVIDQTVVSAENTDPSIEFWIGGEEFELERIGQFGVIPDVTVNLKEKAGYVAVEPLIKEE